MGKETPQDIGWHTENVLNATVSCRDCPSVFLECVKHVIRGAQTYGPEAGVIHTRMSWHTNSLSSTSFSTNIRRGKPNEGSRKICLWTFSFSLWKSGPCCCCDTEDACAPRRLERAGAMGLASTWDYLWGCRTMGGWSPVHAWLSSTIFPPCSIDISITFVDSGCSWPEPNLIANQRESRVYYSLLNSNDKSENKITILGRLTEPSNFLISPILLLLWFHVRGQHNLTTIDLIWSPTCQVEFDSLF